MLLPRALRGATADDPVTTPEESAATRRRDIRGNSNLIYFLIITAAVLALVSVLILWRFSPGGFNFGLGILDNAQPSSSKVAAAPRDTQQAVTNLPSTTQVSTPASASTPSPSASVSHTPSASPTPTRSTSVDAPTVPVVLPSLPSLSTSASVSSPPSSTATTSTPPTSAPPTTPPPPNPDTFAVNAPGASVHVGSVTLSAGDSVQLAGLLPQLPGVTDTFIDWGDGAGRITAAIADNPVPDSGFSYTHSYSADGTYTITWGYTADREHVWTHTVTVSQNPGPPPALSLSLDATPTGVDLTAGDAVSEQWTEWTLDFGDGASQSGDQADQPTAPVSHVYDGAPHTAVLTVAIPDGQLATVSKPTP